MMMRVIKKLREKSAAGRTKKGKPAATKQRKKSIDKISSSELLSMIEKQAYSLYEKRGCMHGEHQKDWYVAEKAVLAGFKK